MNEVLNSQNYKQILNNWIEKNPQCNEYDFLQFYKNRYNSYIPFIKYKKDLNFKNIHTVSNILNTIFHTPCIIIKDFSVPDYNFSTDITVSLSTIVKMKMSKYCEFSDTINKTFSEYVKIRNNFFSFDKTHENGLLNFIKNIDIEFIKSENNKDNIYLLDTRKIIDSHIIMHISIRVNSLKLILDKEKEFLNSISINKTINEYGNGTILPKNHIFKKVYVLHKLSILKELKNLGYEAFQINDLLSNILDSSYKSVGNHVNKINSLKTNDTKLEDEWYNEYLLNLKNLKSTQLQNTKEREKLGFLLKNM